MSGIVSLLALTNSSGIIYEKSMSLVKFDKQATGIWEGAGIFWR